MFLDENKCDTDGQFRSLHAVTPINKLHPNGANTETFRKNGVNKRNCVELKQLWKILTWQNKFKSVLALTASMAMFYGTWFRIEVLGCTPVQSVVGILAMITLVNFLCSLVTIRWVQEYGNWQNSRLASCVYSQITYLGRLVSQIHDSYLNAESQQTTLLVLLVLWILLFASQTAGYVVVNLLMLPGIFVFPAAFLKFSNSPFGQELINQFYRMPQWWSRAGMLCVMAINWPYSGVLMKMVTISICLVLIGCQLRPEEAVQIEQSLNQTLHPIFKTAAKLMSGWLLDAVAFAQSEGMISPTKYQCYSLSEKRQQGTILEFNDSTFSNKENIRNGCN